MGYIKNGSENLLARVSEILFYVWDPIEVNLNPSCRGEYDGYVPIVAVYLAKDLGGARLRELLLFILEVQMGMESETCKQHRKSFDDVIRMLLEWRCVILLDSPSELFSFENNSLESPLADQVKWSTGYGQIEVNKKPTV